MLISSFKVSIINPSSQLRRWLLRPIEQRGHTPVMRQAAPGCCDDKAQSSRSVVLGWAGPSSLPSPLVSKSHLLALRDLQTGAAGPAGGTCELQRLSGKSGPDITQNLPGLGVTSVLLHHPSLRPQGTQVPPLSKEPKDIPSQLLQDSVLSSPRSLCCGIWAPRQQPGTGASPRTARSDPHPMGRVGLRHQANCFKNKFHNHL